MYVLGISAFYHDSAAVLVKDGTIISASEEERFSRIKHSFQFPDEAIKACLADAGITITQVDCVAYYEKPLLRFERVLDSMIKTYPFSVGQFLKGIPEWMGEKIKVERHIRKSLKFKGEIYYIPHHLSHASSSYFVSGFDEAAILTVDGIGEYQTTGLWMGKGNSISSLKTMSFPHSLGFLYSTFTAFLGFKINEDEYKVMGLSAYGKPSYIKQIHQIMDIKDDGSFHLDMKYFSFHKKFKMWSNQFEKLFGKPRKTTDRVTKRQMDIAASIQAVTEEIYFKMLNHLYKVTKIPNLCVAGGVGLNALANGKIFNNTHFKKVFIIGSSGDSGGALGAALFVSRYIKKKSNKNNHHLLLGTIYTDQQIKNDLDKFRLKYKFYKNAGELTNAAAKLLSKGKVIGWFQGKMEFGPRALGARSILAAPFPYSMKEKVNRVKRREQFRPFAGSVIESEARKIFELPNTQKDFPFMNFCFQVKQKAKGKIPAITHEDGSCRIQTVSIKDGIYYSLIKKFYKLTNVPVIMNTSFNLAGEPLVETPMQAIDDFLRTSLDHLVLGNYIFSK